MAAASLFGRISRAARAGEAGCWPIDGSRLKPLEAFIQSYAFQAEPYEEGWSGIVAETRVAAWDESGRGFAGYWRLIVPGRGLVRRQWLDGITSRAERYAERMVFAQ